MGANDFLHDRSRSVDDHFGDDFEYHVQQHDPPKVPYILGAIFLLNKPHVSFENCLWNLARVEGHIHEIGDPYSY